MRRWYLPLTVLGLGSVGAFLLSERGRGAMRAILEKFPHSSQGLLELNNSLQGELDRIQAALDHIAESLEPRPEMGQ